ncbi:MAG: hypothetical protein RMJ85_14965 [Anaerolineales bacterium]|nr:hypothetical protein [Anaerolineales bacterium]
MTRITLFSAPKPFTHPHIAILQRNALRSWMELPDVNIVLLGDEPGLAETAAEFGLTHVRQVPRSESGAPLMDAMFRLARQASSTPLYAIVNADILLLGDFVQAANTVSAQLQQFVLMGQRWDLDVTESLDFSPGWQERLRERVRRQGTLHRPAGSDYFLFPARCFVEIPPFVIGRAGWDNWMIYHARKSGFPAIDATHDVMIIHQNHDYSHLPGGRPHYKHPETELNIRLAGGRPMTRFTLLDTDKRLVNGKILPQTLNGPRLWRRLETWPLIRFGSISWSERLNKLGKILWKR